MDKFDELFFEIEELRESVSRQEEIIIVVSKDTYCELLNSHLTLSTPPYMLYGHRVYTINNIDGEYIRPVIVGYNHSLTGMKAGTMILDIEDGSLYRLLKFPNNVSAYAGTGLTVTIDDDLQAIVTCGQDTHISSQELDDYLDSFKIVRIRDWGT